MSAVGHRWFLLIVWQGEGSGMPDVGILPTAGTDRRGRHPGLAGRDLSPKGRIERGTSNVLDASSVDSVLGGDDLGLIPTLQTSAKARAKRH